MSQHSRYSQKIIADQYPVSLLVALVDLALIILSAYAAYYVRFDTVHMPTHYLAASLAAAFLIVITQSAVGVYSSWRGRGLIVPMLGLYAAWALAIGMLMILAFTLKLSTTYSRLWCAYAITLGVGSITILRLSAAIMLHALRRKGRNMKGIVMVESSDAPHGISARIPLLARHGYHIQSRIPFQDDPAWFTQLGPRVAASGAHEVWLCLPMALGGLIEPIVYALRHETAEIRYIPELGSHLLLNHRIRPFAGMYVVDISCSPMTGLNQALKRFEDLVLGSLISLLILPACIAIAIAIRLTSPGPIIFKQYRIGMKGQRFTVHKFRSMEVHTEPGSRITQAAYGDPRITRLGAFLRRTSLDELPQFYNVLKGDMSIVGPRPHALDHNEHYKDIVEYYMKRHKVKPGITGWAQVNGYRGATDTLDKMQKRVEYDLWYINNWSVLLDLRIILWTIFKGFLNRQP